MNLLSSNPLDTLQRAFRSKSKGLKVLATITLVVAIAGALASYTSHNFLLERLGQFLLAIATLSYFFIDSALRAREEERLEARIDRAEQVAVENPDKPGPLWEAARARLELYFQRNLSQIRSIFWITCLVMMAGFVMIAYGLSTAQSDQAIKGSALAVGAGLLTEFVAATFIVVYKSTMSQADTFVATLERINSVGMAIQILDSIPDSEGELKNQSRADLVRQILEKRPREESKKGGRKKPIKRAANKGGGADG
jgi:hypothetical protein